MTLGARTLATRFLESCKATRGDIASEDVPLVAVKEDVLLAFLVAAVEALEGGRDVLVAAGYGPSPTVARMSNALALLTARVGTTEER